MNKVILVGNLTKDPDLKQTTTGVNVATFQIAVPRKFTRSTGERDSDFISIVAWRALGENCATYTTKGRKVAVCGSLQTRTYEKDGTKRVTYEVVADEVEFLTPKNPIQEEQEAFSEAKKKGIEDLEPFTDDDLPF